MAWDVVSKTTNQTLASSEVNQIGDNFTALAKQQAGAPALDVSSFIATVASIDALYVASSFVAPQVSSMGKLNVESLTINGDVFTALKMNDQGSDYSPTVADAGGTTFFTNKDAGAIVEYTLPESGAIRLDFVAIDSDGFKITAAASDKIITPSEVTALGGSLTYAEYGSAVGVVRAKDYEWFVLYESIVGTEAYNRCYLMGGANSTVRVTTIQKFTLSNEDHTEIAATVDTARYKCGYCHSNTKGYAMGGNTAADTGGDGGNKNLEEVTFADDTSTNVGGSVMAHNMSATGGATHTLKGYALGGQVANQSTTDQISDLTYSSETSTDTTDNLGTARTHACTVQSTDVVYQCGGNDADGGNKLTSIEKYDMSTTTRTTASGALDTAKERQAGVYSTTTGYVMGGSTGSNTAVIEDVNLSSETSDVISATLDTARANVGSMTGSLKGYCLGGYVTGPSAKIDDLTFSTEASVEIAEAMTTDLSSLGNGVLRKA